MMRSDSVQKKSSVSLSNRDEDATKAEKLMRHYIAHSDLL